MFYDYTCSCGNRFERNQPVEARDVPQPCDRCGGMATRLFTPGMIVVPFHFGWSRGNVVQTYEQARAQDMANEAYLASKPAPKPTFAECLAKEMDAVGIRRPYPQHMIDPKVAFQDA